MTSIRALAARAALLCLLISSAPGAGGGSAVARPAPPGEAHTVVSLLPLASFSAMHSGLVPDYASCQLKFVYQGAQSKIRTSLAAVSGLRSGGFALPAFPPFEHHGSYDNDRFFGDTLVLAYHGVEGVSRRHRSAPRAAGHGRSGPGLRFADGAARPRHRWDLLGARHRLVLARGHAVPTAARRPARLRPPRHGGRFPPPPGGGAAMSAGRKTWRAGLVLAGAMAVWALRASAAFAAEYPGTNGTFLVDVYNNPYGHQEIRIRYRPDARRIGVCHQIYLVQTVKYTDGAGNVIKPETLKPAGPDPGPFESLGNDLTAGGTAVDHKPSEKDVYYNGEDKGKDIGTPGACGGSADTISSMTDEPWIPDEWMPAGVNTVNGRFEDCAICKDTGKILDCVTWSYVRHRGDGESDHGEITGPAGPGAGPPSAEFVAAKDKFEKNHDNDTKCPEARAEQHLGEQNVETGYRQYQPPFPHAGQPTQVFWDVVNSSGQPMNAVAWSARDHGGARLLGAGVVPALAPFSFSTVIFAVPPVANPAEVDPVVFTVDPANSIQEFDETDNADTLPVGFYGPVGVGDDPPEPVRARLTASPNPFRARTSLGFSFPRAAWVTLEVLDVAGARVRTLLDGRLSAGAHALTWDSRDDAGRRAPAGAYLVRLNCEGSPRMPSR